MSNRAFPISDVQDLQTTRPFYEQLGLTQAYQFPPEGEPESPPGSSDDPSAPSRVGVLSPSSR